MTPPSPSSSSHPISLSPDTRPSTFMASSASSASSSQSFKALKPSRCLPRVGPMPFRFKPSSPSDPSPSSPSVLPLTASNLALLTSFELALATNHPDEVSHFSSDSESSVTSSFEDHLVVNSPHQRLLLGLPIESLPNCLPPPCTPEHDTTTPHCYDRNVKSDGFPFPPTSSLTTSIKP